MGYGLPSSPGPPPADEDPILPPGEGALLCGLPGGTPLSGAPDCGGYTPGILPSRPMKFGFFVSPVGPSVEPLFDEGVARPSDLSEDCDNVDC